MIRFFKSPQPAVLGIIPVIILVLWAQIFFHAKPVTDANCLPLWNFIYDLLKNVPSWINFILLFALISGEAIYLNLLLNRHEVLYKNSFLPALAFALFISATTGFMQFHPLHLINLLLIRIFDRLLALYKDEFPVAALFDCGFIAGIAAVIYFPAILLLPFIMAALGVLRPFSLREWMIMLIGFFLPYFFLSIIFFWNKSLLDFWHSYIDLFKHIRPHVLIIKDAKIITLAILMGLILVLSLVKLRMNYLKNIIRTRIYQQLFVIYLLFGTGCMFLCREIQLIHFVFLAVPIAMFYGYYFVSAKKRFWIYEYTLWALIGTILWNHIG